jgi:hypothetical protein
MWGLAIGAAMGGGIAALQGKKMDDVLKGAALGGATGALGGALAPATGLVGGVTSEAATVAMPIAESTITSAPLAETVNAGITSLPSSGITVNGSQLIGNQIPSVTGMFPNAAAPLSEAASSVPTLANTASNQAATKTAGTGFFDSGFGKTLADNKGMLGLGALGLMALKPQGSGGSPEQTSYIRPYSYNQSNQTYSAQAPIKASDFGTRSVANGGIIGMAEGGDVTTEEQRESRANPTLEALAAIQQAQQPYQPPAVSQGIAQPLIQPQMAQIQQRYAAPQRQVPDAFQYQAPSFVKYSNTGGGGIAGVGGGGGEAIDPVTKQPVKTVAQIIAAKAAAKPAVSSPAYTLPGGSNPANTYTGPGMNGDAESYYDRYPVAEVYNYETNQPTRPNNPTSGSPEFNVPSNVPVDQSSGLAEIQQRYANMGYTDYVPTATNTDSGAANGGLMRSYAMGGGIGGYYPEPDDGGRDFTGIGALNQGPQYPMQGYAMGGHLGGYSDGGQLLKGPGDGVSDDIPAQIGNRQPARLADGEFVVPARIVSELGNGSTDAGAKRLYAMMDRIQKNRGKTVGKGKVAVNSKSDKYLPA